MPGLPRTPTAILKLRGSTLVRERKGEPQPELGRPACPRTLSKRARAVWRKLIPMLDGMGVLAKVDGNPAARYCALLVQWWDAMAFLDEHGSQYPIKKLQYGVVGTPPTMAVVGFKSFPVARLVTAWGSELLRLEQNFGLTPAARARLSVDKPREDKDDKRRFFRGSAG